MKTRNWRPCCVCGKTHQNPRSSSTCEECGRAQSEARIAAEREAEEQRMSSPLGQFLAMSEEDRREWVFERLSNAGETA